MNKLAWPPFHYPEDMGSSPESRPAGPQSPDDPDQILIREVLEAPEPRARAAFDALYHRYRERVFRVLAGMLRNREDALDATQDVFLRAFRALGRFDPKARFYTWLYRIAVNRGIDLLRDRKKRSHEEYDAEHTEVKETSPSRSRRPERDAETQEVRERLDHALGQLSEVHRTVFLLYTGEGLSYDEIAEVTNVPVGTVMSRLFHARKKLKAQLPAEWDPGGRRRREIEK